jgi:hypothetical protein
MNIIHSVAIHLGKVFVDGEISLILPSLNSIPEHYPDRITYELTCHVSHNAAMSGAK